MSRSRFSRREVALGALAVGATAACTGKPPEGSQSGGAAGSSAPGGSGATTGGTGGGAKKPVVISLDSGVDLLDPQAWRAAAAMAATTACYDMLLEQDYKPSADGRVLVGQEKFSPALAASSKLSEDGKKLTYTLRDGLKHADGSPVTAEDVRWTIERCMKGPGYTSSNMPFIGIKDIGQVKAVDDKTIEFTDGLFKSPLWDHFMGMQTLSIYNKKLALQNKDDKDAYAGTWLGKNVAGCGAYTVEEYDKDKVLKLKVNPNYYDPKRVGNSGITIQVVADPNQRALLLRNGNLDLAQGLPPDQLKQLESDPNLAVVHEQSNRLVYLGFNTKKAPFDNPKVRQALIYAMPYQALVDGVMKGYARKATGVIPENMETYDKEATGPYEENLEKAKQLLEAAGVKDISTTIFVRNAIATDNQSAVFIQSNLAKVGVKAEVKPLPTAEFTQRSNAREFPMYILQYLGWGADPFYQAFYMAGEKAGTNFASYANPAMEAKINEGLRTGDPAQRKKLSAEIQKTLREDSPVIPLFNPDWTFAIRKGLKGLAKDNTEQLRVQYLSKD